jgi:hypothetical protein
MQEMTTQKTCKWCDMHEHSHYAPLQLFAPFLLVDKHNERRLLACKNLREALAFLALCQPLDDLRHRFCNLARACTDVHVHGVALELDET